MESKINYTIVGLFVVVLTASLLGFAYWLTKGFGQQTYNYYYVHLSESVAGMSADATVKYRGVDVGTVTNIGLNPKNPEEVELLLKIYQNILIKTDTTAAVSYYGITGLAYIELKGLDKNAPLLNAEQGGIPVIPSRPSTIQRIDQSLSHLSEKSAQTLDNINRLLSDKNLENFADLLIESKELAHNLHAQLAGIQALVDNGVVMETKVSEASDRVGAASISVEKMANSFELATEGLNQQLSKDMQQSFKSVNRLLNDLDTLTGNLQTTIQNIKSSPADLLFKRTQVRPGPGEEGFREH